MKSRDETNICTRKADRLPTWINHLRNFGYEDITEMIDYSPSPFHGKRTGVLSADD